MNQSGGQRGFVALISTIIISAILISLAIGAGMGSIFARFDALGLYDKAQARLLARSCVNIALLALATSSDPVHYSVSNQAVAVDGKHGCTIAAIMHDGAEARIDAYAAAGDSYTSVTATVTLTPRLSILSWSDSP